MKIRHSLFFYLASLSATPIIGGYNLYSNYENNLYAVEHDTIAIPFAAIIGTLFISLLLLVLQRPYRLRKSNNMPRTFLTKTASVLATIVTAVLLLDNIIYWSHPNHLPTFLTFLTAFCLYIYYQLQLYDVISAGPNC
jgi:4-hydroxybenzoate polyprenyltransferase